MENLNQITKLTKNVKIIQRNCSRTIFKVHKNCSTIFIKSSHVGFHSEIAEASIKNKHQNFFNIKFKPFLTKRHKWMFENVCRKKVLPFDLKEICFHFKVCEIKQFWGNSWEKFIHEIVGKSKPMLLSYFNFRMLLRQLRKSENFSLEFLLSI